MGECNHALGLGRVLVGCFQFGGLVFFDLDQLLLEGGGLGLHLLGLHHSGGPAAWTWTMNSVNRTG
jgi:hypothetical protein